MTSTAGPQLGVAFVPNQPPERLRSFAQAADAAGLDELWVWEDCFKESGIATATAALAFTERIRVGVGLLPVPLRNVALVAMEIATLDRLFPGRFVAGVGHGVQEWMAQVGARVESPMTLLREYAVALRRLLAGEEVTMDGRYVRLDRVRLDWPPNRPPALMLGGAGPKSLELAGRLGDGTLLGAALGDDQVESACRIITAAAEAGSASGAGPHKIVATQIAATGPGAQRRVDAELPRWGQVAGLGIAIAGDARVFAASIRRLAEVGVTSVVIQPTEDEPDLEGLIHFLGSEVRPLLAADQ
ncbi:alkanesulfonate monooxygenase SsuD/methylene tetrahydromethanopterin reductase-like flavin-dependent oxidoreductase (luciferase family) [Microlunatus panaciterrae]|uniref:Alkanesulfonate monooxygenase SsuD/methylene tetrahydromethanopterin reductase-like flavin-dependent oxidoreductase (Luciferase family) n=1 Tax=Microlunatus panaciterrae TaxID=400768 RepID=A0ABS2RIM5_9ACTN|nr:LLM class flavin-dependent oxidoreductase [Microlunatus panaciterrae]MBM7798850.1 alkanesulfonate monooxygenase SsuD/methylene tetrahydromethanopterin reductase-like flavin-dependent oxidoreductase (luciferase family) [Microlunatus panaciterrae]